MGETISYSSGKVPESDDTRSLIGRARLWAATVDAKPTEEWINGYVLDGINYVEMLCDALEEREREVERLREELEVERRGISHYSKGAYLSTDCSGTREWGERG